MLETEPLRILAISGSLRTGSFSTAILEALRTQASCEMSIVVKTLEDIPLYNEDLDTEPALPPVAKLRADVSASDGVVIATPEYNHGISGVLKNALDWASRPAFMSCFSGKPVIIISSGPGYTGGVRAQYQLRETLVSMHAHLVPGREIVVTGVAKRMKEDKFADRDSLSDIADRLDKLQADIRSRQAVSA